VLLYPFDVDPESDEAVTSTAFNIGDFELGVDQLSVDADAVTDGGVLASARLEETTNSDGTSLTKLILAYENEAQQPIEVVVNLSGVTGMTWDDVEFLGDQVPVLTPVA